MTRTQHTLIYTGTQVTIKLCMQGGADMGSQDDLNSCTDACTHSKQGVGTEMQDDWDIKHSAIQGHPGFHKTMHRECYTHQQAGRQKFMYWYMYTFETKLWEQFPGAHNYMYWCMYTFQTKWGNKWGDWDTNTLLYRDTQVSIKLCIGGGPDMGSQDGHKFM